MERRTALAALAAFAAPAQAQSKAIQLHVDLDVDPSREKEMVANYRKVFQPTISKQTGFVDVKLMKLRKVAAGTGPANAPYRLLISFQTEEQRLKWVATDDHQRVWPTIEKTLRGNKFGAVLYDLV